MYHIVAHENKRKTNAKKPSSRLLSNDKEFEQADTYQKDDFVIDIEKDYIPNK